MVEKEIELLPCPFCGSMPIEEYSGSWLVVTCSDDSCVLGNMAITTIGWNRRARTTFGETECPYNRQIQSENCLWCKLNLADCKCKPFTDSPSKESFCKERGIK